MPHSGIRESKVIGTFPRHIAACHALHSLLTPRHPLYALTSLTTNSVFHILNLESLYLGILKTLLSLSRRFFYYLLCDVCKRSFFYRLSLPDTVLGNLSIFYSYPFRAFFSICQPTFRRSFSEGRSLGELGLPAEALAKAGGDDRDRTGDPLLAKQTLSQTELHPRLSVEILNLQFQIENKGCNTWGDPTIFSPPAKTLVPFSRIENRKLTEIVLPYFSIIDCSISRPYFRLRRKLSCPSRESRIEN